MTQEQAERLLQLFDAGYIINFNMPRISAYLHDMWLDSDNQIWFSSDMWCDARLVTDVQVNWVNVFQPVANWENLPVDNTTANAVG